MAIFAKCSICRKEIPFGGQYYRCTVRSCNMGKDRLYFCSEKCWEAHLPTARHKNASFVIEQAPDEPSKQ
ncbi:MAG: hypothetical protein J7M25_11800 [Deltaproteobacteria bacterium]|nr:hypothetical protein [Deltaproteobacteria bacterium]